MSLDPLYEIQQRVATVLTSDPYFSGIPVICERKGDVLNQIQAALGKLGLCVVIETLTGRPEHAGIGAYSLELKMGISITERVIINQGATGSKKPASEVLARVLCLLNPIRATPAYAEDFVTVNDSGGLLVYLVNCTATAGFQITGENP